MHRINSEKNVNIKIRLTKVLIFFKFSGVPKAVPIFILSLNDNFLLAIKINAETIKINPKAPICISASITNLPNIVYCSAGTTVANPATQTDAADVNIEFNKSCGN